MLDHIGTQYKGSHATIIGASNHVGRPMSLELLLAGVTVTTAHKFTTNTKEMVSSGRHFDKRSRKTRFGAGRLD